MQSLFPDEIDRPTEQPFHLSSHQVQARLPPAPSGAKVDQEIGVTAEPSLVSGDGPEHSELAGAVLSGEGAKFVPFRTDDVLDSEAPPPAGDADPGFVPVGRLATGAHPNDRAAGSPARAATVAVEREEFDRGDHSSIQQELTYK